MKKVVLYHANCYDGFGAAYCAWLRLRENADYLSVGYGSEVPDLSQYDNVFIVDFSYPRDQMLAMCETHRVVVLDHHKTAQANFEGLTHPNLTAIFDMEKSGAMLSWEYFHRDIETCSPNSGQPYPAPRLIQHIQDRDLWTYRIPGSREVHAALVSYPFDFELWDKFKVEDLITEGKALIRMYSSLVDNICKKPFSVKIGEHTVPAVNTSIAWSEVGEKLGEMFPDAPFVASFTEFEDQTMWSLRTSKNHRDFDVSAIARLFGGGGHAAAAGFNVNRVGKIVVENRSEK